MIGHLCELHFIFKYMMRFFILICELFRTCVCFTTLHFEINSITNKLRNSNCHIIIIISGQLRDDILIEIVSWETIAKQKSPTMSMWRVDLDYVHSFKRLPIYWRMTVNSTFCHTDTIYIIGFRAK